MEHSQSEFSSHVLWGMYENYIMDYQTFSTCNFRWSPADHRAHTIIWNDMANVADTLLLSFEFDS